jgi:hypothetical protein
VSRSLLRQLEAIEALVRDNEVKGAEKMEEGGNERVGSLEGIEIGRSRCSI